MPMTRDLCRIGMKGIAILAGGVYAGSSSIEGTLNGRGFDGPVRDQQLCEDARLLRIEIERCDEAEIVVIDLDVAVHETRACA